MSTPRDIRSEQGVGVPNETPVEMDDAEDRTSRVDAVLPVELPPLPVDTTPGLLRLVPRSATVTRPPTGAPVDELIGRRCGGYVIDALLGEGGMGKVYLATNPRMGKRAAVKVILPEHSKSPQTVDRFLQEAKAAAQIDDPNIIDLLDASELEDGRAYLLMPFVEGTSLEDLCERFVMLPLDVAASILFQICSGLDAAHQHGIIHRDIKPHNILVGPRQQREHFVRIVDFGIAKLLDPHLAGKFKTQTKALMGTPGYMAPEQAAGGRNIDARADVYAVGVVAYRMLTGRRPYTADSLYELIESQASDAPFPRPRELRPDIPAEWDDAIMAALVNKRDKRLATVRELALRFARGIPQGDQMLRALAPRLAETKLPPSAPTLAPFLDHDIARRAGSGRLQAAAPRRRIGLAAWHLAALVCVTVGLGLVVGSQLRTADSPPSDGTGNVAIAPTAAQQSSNAPPSPAASPPEPAPTPAVAGVQSTASTPSAPNPSTNAPVATTERSSAVPAEVKAAPPPPPKTTAAPEPATTSPAPSKELQQQSAPKAPERIAASPAPSDVRPRTAAATAAKPRTATTSAATSASTPAAVPTSDGPISREDAARLAKLGIGMLIVNAKPWAQLSINGKLEGFTPKRKELPAGRYTIRLTNNDRNEEVVITITPGKVSTVERSFR